MLFQHVLNFSHKYVWIYYLILGAIASLLLLVFSKNSEKYPYLFIISILIGIILLVRSWLKKDLVLFSFATYLGVVYSALSYFFIQVTNLIMFERIGYMLITIVVAIVILNTFTYFRQERLIFWMFPIAVILVGITVGLLVENARLFDYLFYVGISIGISLLGSGLYWKLFGLVIPGCLVIGSSAGVYFAWAKPDAINALVRTGIMLVWIALGWGMVTVFSRMRTLKFLWWPLIPGGIFAMVGWGLYIGGSPQSAVGFIGNTGSIGLLIFGIYILLLRRGIHR